MFLREAPLYFTVHTVPLFSQRRRHLPLWGGETQQEEQREETQEQEAAQTQEGEEGRKRKDLIKCLFDSSGLTSQWFYLLQKKKHKKHKHKAKQQKKKETDSSDEDSDEDSDGEDAHVTTDELLKRSEVTVHTRN